MTTIRAPVWIAMPVNVKRRRLECSLRNSGVSAIPFQSCTSAAGAPPGPASRGGAAVDRPVDGVTDMARSSRRGWSLLQRFGRDPAQLRALQLAAVGGVGGG